MILTIPILWRYLLKQYLQILFLCLVSFVVLLITTRLDEIAHFAALGAQARHLFGFLLFQIPYIFPIALPISTLISSFLVFRKLSENYELVAMRACGLSLNTLLIPILITSCLLSLVSFFITSEIATFTHHRAHKWKSELRSVNPLLLLHNQRLRRVKGIYFDILGPSKMGENAEDTLIAMPTQNKERIQLFLAKKMRVKSHQFTIENGTFVTPISSKTHDNEPFLIENYDQLQTKVEDFSLLFQEKRETISPDYLQLPQLITYTSRLRKLPNQGSSLKKEVGRCETEVIRRFAVAFSILPLTLMGAAFGISISRRRKIKGLLLAFILTAFEMLCYFSAKSVETTPLLAGVIYFTPLILILLFAIRKLQLISQGRE